jgi:hypothetical protein
MPAIARIVSLLSAVTLAAGLAGCGSDVASKIMCDSAASCLKASGSLYSDVDASVDQLPQCCSNVCVVASLGCDHGFRYLTSQPGLGDCVATDPMCPAQAKPDLGTGGGTEDLLSEQHD